MAELLRSKAELIKARCSNLREAVLLAYDPPNGPFTRLTSRFVRYLTDGAPWEKADSPRTGRLNRLPKKLGGESEARQKERSR